jgi:hypothetical protein
MPSARPLNRVSNRINSPWIIFQQNLALENSEMNLKSRFATPLVLGTICIACSVGPEAETEAEPEAAQELGQTTAAINYKEAIDAIRKILGFAPETPKPHLIASPPSTTKRTPTTSQNTGSPPTASLPSDKSQAFDAIDSDPTENRHSTGGHPEKPKDSKNAETTDDFESDNLTTKTWTPTPADRQTAESRKKWAERRAANDDFQDAIRSDCRGVPSLERTGLCTDIAGIFLQCSSGDRLSRRSAVDSLSKCLGLLKNFRCSETLLTGVGGLITACRESIDKLSPTDTRNSIEGEMGF